MRIALTTIILLILFVSSTTFAQPGSLDTSFEPNLVLVKDMRTTSIQSDGKIIVAGEEFYHNGMVTVNIARLNTDGKRDTSFSIAWGANGYIASTSIQSDGKIIIGGSFTSFNLTTRNRIARLNTDGSLDTTFNFNPGSGANGPISCTSIQSDGKIIIAGAFTSYNGTSRNCIARLNTDGSIDTSFNPGTGVSGVANLGVSTISIQNDGKIIIGGGFTTYNGTIRMRIARLNSNGSLDTSFDPGMGANDWVTTTSIQSDGKIVIGGYFTSYNGTVRTNIARLNTDGSLDNFFNSGAVPTFSVQTTSIQSDGKIFIGGLFHIHNGMPRKNIALLNTDGSLDTSFDPGTGAYGVVYSSSIQSDGKIIIAGAFYSYDGNNIARIARINSTVTGINSLENEFRDTYVFPNPLSNNGILHSNIELKNATLTIFNLSGQSLLQIENIYGNSIDINRENLPAGMYFIQLMQDDRMIMCDKLVVGIE